MQALAIINLSTLDAYTNAFGEEKGAQLAHAIYEKVAAFNGPVYVVDQRWLVTEDSEPRMALLRSLRPLMLQKDIRFVEFEEDQQEWRYFLRTFRERLREDGITSLVLGGLWYDPETGAVSEAKKFLAPSIPSIVDKKIVAQVPGRTLSGRSWRS